MDDETKKAAIIISLIILVFVVIVMFQSLRMKPIEQTIESSMEADGMMQDN